AVRPPWSACATQAVDLVAGQTELLMAGRLPAQCARLAATERSVAQADRQLNRLEARASMAFGMASTLTLVGVLLAVGWLVEQGVVGAPGAALALLVALAAMEPFAALRRGAVEAGRTWLSIQRLAPQVVQAPAAIEIKVTEPPPGCAVRLQQAAAQHRGSPHRALAAVDLQIPVGTQVALIGASGAGKSTLLSLIAGELPAVHGQVLAQPCTWLTQRTELFQDSLRDNLRLAQPGAAMPSCGRRWRMPAWPPMCVPCPRGWTRAWVKVGWACPAGRPAAWHWRGCCCTLPRAGCWMSPPKDWMPPRPGTCCNACASRCTGTP
ncbi:ATP-binding cassette domain-containing protein, partial [Comamonas aquatica]